MRPITFDIIVPIYNIEQELDACLASLARQTYSHFRILMIDDGSTDGSSLIAKRYAAQDQRFCYVFKENGGLSDARNTGFQMARHDYVLFIDGDDYIEDRTLSLVQDQLVEHDLDVLEFNGWYVENGEKTSLFNHHYIDSGLVKNGRDYFVDNVKAACMYSAVCLKVVRRSLLVDSQLLFEKGLLHEDELWTPQLYLEARRIMYLSTPLYHYVQRPGSIMHQTNKDKHVRDARHIYYQLEKIYQEYDLSTSQREILMDYLARKMLGTFYEPNTIGISQSDRQYVMRHAKRLKSRGQAILFNLCPKLLPVLSKLIKKVIRYKN